MSRTEELSRPEIRDLIRRFRDALKEDEAVPGNREKILAIVARMKELAPALHADLHEHIKLAGLSSKNPNFSTLVH